MSAESGPMASMPWRKSVIIGVIVAVIATLFMTNTGAALADPGDSQGPNAAITQDAGEQLADLCQPYPDVDSSNTHCRNIEWLKTKQITKPKSGLYDPLGNVTRGSMAAFLFRLTYPGLPAPVCDEKPFSDVAVDNIFCGYIQWAASKKIAYGYSDGTYGPSKPVTRGAMAAFLYRIVNPGVAAPKCTVQVFKDIGTTHQFCGVITWLHIWSITSGVGNGDRYAPVREVTRGSMASFLRRVDKLVGFGGGAMCTAPTRSGEFASYAPPMYQLGPVASRTSLVANVVGLKFGLTTIYGWRASAIDAQGHPAGLALDFMIHDIADGKAVGFQIAEYLQHNQDWMGVRYVIYRQKIWMAGTDFGRWTKMEDRGSPTQNHMDHVHVSLAKDAGMNPGCGA